MLGFKELSASEATQKMQDTLDVTRRINAQFKDPVRILFLEILVYNFFNCNNRICIIELCLGADDVRLRVHSRVSLHVRD